MMTRTKTKDKPSLGKNLLPQIQLLRNKEAHGRNMESTDWHSAGYYMPESAEKIRHWPKQPGMADEFLQGDWLGLEVDSNSRRIADKSISSWTDVGTSHKLGLACTGTEDAFEGLADPRAGRRLKQVGEWSATQYKGVVGRTNEYISRCGEGSVDLKKKLERSNKSAGIHGLDCDT